jgi:hypothetical protein
LSSLQSSENRGFSPPRHDQANIRAPLVGRVEFPNRCQRAVLGATSTMIKLVTAPIRGIVRFPLVQVAFVVALITFLQAADDNTAFGQLFNILDRLVDSTVRLISAIFNVKAFTRSWLISGLMIAYVYLACLLVLSLVRLAIRALIDSVGRSNAFC